MLRKCVAIGGSTGWRGGLDAPESSDEAWLARVAEVLEEQHGDGLGCGAFVYGPGGPAVTFGAGAARGTPGCIDARYLFEATTSTAPRIIRTVFGSITSALASELGAACERSFHARVFDWGVRDALCINAKLGELRGAAFLVLRARRRPLKGERVESAAIASLLESALHARGESRWPGVTRAEARRLRAAGFVPRRIVDDDGRRCLLVEPIDYDPLDLLSAKERAAVLALRPDTTNKEIAADMALAPSTVGVLLHRAAAKLRVRGRGELVALAAETRSRRGED